MKVYTKVVINIKTLNVVEEDCHYSSSPVALLKGGGGGGSSGRTDYPDYMKTFHQEALDDAATDALTDSLVTHLNTAHGANPFDGVTAFDPATRIGYIDDAIAALETFVAGWDAGPLIAAEVDAYADIIDDRVENTVLARFQRGMQDINAVQSSAFTIGQAIIEAFADRDIALYTSQLERQRDSDKTKLETTLAATTIEANRLVIVAEKEEKDRQAELDEFEASWDLKTWQYAGNLLASIAGASISIPAEGMSHFQSAMSGALSGAAMGAMAGSAVPGIGTGAGTGIGAALGMVGGLFS